MNDLPGASPKDGKLTDAVLKGPGGGELSHAGNRTRAPLVATAYSIEIFVWANGNGAFTIHHGGASLKFPFADTQRKEIIKALGGVTLP